MVSEGGEESRRGKGLTLVDDVSWRGPGQREGETCLQERTRV